MKKRFLTLILLAAFALTPAAALRTAALEVQPATQADFDVPCQAAILIDQDSGTVLYEKNADEQRPIASITKVMTLLLTFRALEEGRVTLDDLGPVSEHSVRKLAHFAEYCLEGMLLTLCLRVYTARFVRHISWPLLGGLLTAVTDETIQKYVSGRSSQLTDVWIDFAGIVAGLMVALVILLIVRAITAFYAIKRENRRLRAERDSLRRSRDAHIRRTVSRDNTATPDANGETEEEPEEEEDAI